MALPQELLFMIGSNLPCVLFTEKKLPNIFWDPSKTRCDGTQYGAAKSGHISCLRHIHESGEPIYDTVYSLAAENGHLDFLKYLYENIGLETNSSICDSAAKNGHLDCLRYAREKGCHATFWAYAFAASGGHLNCLSYLYETSFQYGPAWDVWTCINAAKHGHLDCLRYAHEHGCHWNRWVYIWASKGGHLDCLRYAQENGCPQ